MILQELTVDKQGGPSLPPPSQERARPSKATKYSIALVARGAAATSGFPSHKEFWRKG